MKNEHTSSTVPLLLGMAAGAALGAAGVMATNTSQRQMRRTARKIAPQRLPVVERPIRREEIFTAREMLLFTSASLCVGISHFEGRPIGRGPDAGRPGPVARWLRDRMRDTLRSAAAPVLQVAPENIDIRISCQGAAPAPAAPAAPAAVAAAPLATPVAQPVHEAPATPLHTAPSRPSQPLWQPSQCSLPLPAPTLRPRTRQRWRFSFDDFVVGPCNAMAVAAAKDICHDGGCVETLFVSSASGLGKTHIMQSVPCRSRAVRPVWPTFPPRIWRRAMWLPCAAMMWRAFAPVCAIWTYSCWKTCISSRARKRCRTWS